jgi:hypothetical protein
MEDGIGILNAASDVVRRGGAAAKNGEPRMAQ